ncbi:AAA-ATPase ASD [Populus alba x Populus x berolinensis]|uniref:AAA-ATPase ASD n=1 Tax=Populus alba x Populus x berolinensis TaxID=444605 RepID=A0AAD6R2I7_9ROSI|nr:AAA-ATPase ASD [Populus alba x Populus x berolinensis]
MSYAYPYIHVTFHEFTSERLKRSEAFSAIQNYLGSNSTKTAKRLKADVVRNNEPVVLTMDDYEEVTDVFEGVKVWWSSSKTVPKTQSISFYPVADERRYYRLTFHKSHRDVITEKYLEHVLKEGKAIAVRNRQRKLFTNNPKWSHVVFEHPATFDTLAMETKKKEDIKKDLTKFSKGKDYYAKIGKAWKRGYLLYGPPGTGKSTMISAMANFLDYDVYDLELTTVKDNSELRKLLIETTGKSIIVIEDIDCSLDLTGQKKEAEDERKSGSKVTLSGLLNFIDGLWSACGGERIIVFTTNYVDKLDPALIRRGRMDKHIELSYCCFEAFKVLAKNYLELKSHETFGKIEELLGETKMTPADVAENLMPRSDEEDEEECLKRLIEGLETAKEEARKKAEEEAVSKAEKADKEGGETSSQVAKENCEISAEEAKENGVIAGG